MSVAALRGTAREDEWGFDEGFAEAVSPALELLYRRWWRVAVTGIEHVPAHGRAMLVANHGGLLPWDALMIGTAILEEHPLPRHPRFLLMDWAFELPFASVALRRLGGVPASPHNATRLLEGEHLVAVFPEGPRAVTRPHRERFRVERFGRGGFVEVALRCRAPIVPCAVVGSQDAYPKLADARPLARALGLPSLPVTPTFPWLGPLGLVPLPARWRIEFCEPVELEAYGPDAADDRRLVLELSDAVREQVQAKVHENVVKREGAFV